MKIDKNQTVFLQNPWSSQGYGKEMTWQEILTWARAHIHIVNRKSWVARARRAAKRGDSDTLGIMILGS